MDIKTLVVRTWNWLFNHVYSIYSSIRRPNKKLKFLRTVLSTDIEDKVNNDCYENIDSATKLLLLTYFIIQLIVVKSYIEEGAYLVTGICWL